MSPPCLTKNSEAGEKSGCEAYVRKKKSGRLRGLEEKAHHFLPIGIHRKISDLYKVQLFLTLKFFLLVLIARAFQK